MCLFFLRATEALREIKRERNEGKRFSIERIAYRVHSGWAHVALESWDTLVYGPEPTSFKKDEHGHWLEALFSSEAGYTTYCDRVSLAEKSYTQLSEEEKNQNRVVAEVSYR